MRTQFIIVMVSYNFFFLWKPKFRRFLVYCVGSPGLYSPCGATWGACGRPPAGWWGARWRWRCAGAAWRGPGSWWCTRRGRCRSDTVRDMSATLWALHTKYITVRVTSSVVGCGWRNAAHCDRRIRRTLRANGGAGVGAFWDVRRWNAGYRGFADRFSWKAINVLIVTWHSSDKLLFKSQTVKRPRFR